MRQSSDGRLSKSKWKEILCLLLLALAVLVLFRTSPTQGDFWWSDAPRHAMDGAFFYDMARAMPVGHVKQWAINYYLKYPAVTVLTYPPLFALVEAVFFSIFGISHYIAQLTVAVFFVATAWGAYALARRWVGRMVAFSAALLFIGTPSMVLWGRQVMLEIPTFAFLLWSAYFFFRYLDSFKPRYLYVSVLLVLGAAYTKQPAVFILLAYLPTLYFVQKNSLFRRAEFWWSALLFVVGMLPLAIFTWLWGRTNMQQAVGGAWVQHSRWSAATWSYVASYEWPRQMGWIVLVLAAIYCIGCIFRKNWRLPGPGLFFLLAWVITGYVFFTGIAVSSARYTIFLVFPLAFFSILAIARCLPATIASYIALAFAAGSFCYTLAKHPEPRITGYREAAHYVCSVAPADSVVMFSGWRDGSFVFNVRSLPECKNLTVLRADKLLLRVVIHRDLFGVQELGVAETNLKTMLGRFGVHYIVIEPDFWNDLQSMKMMVRVLHQDQFKLLNTISAVNSREHNGSNLEIYENLAPLAQGRNVLKVELPVSGIAIEGTVGQDNRNK